MATDGTDTICGTACCFAVPPVIHPGCGTGSFKVAAGASVADFFFAPFVLGTGAAARATAGGVLAGPEAERLLVASGFAAAAGGAGEAARLLVAVDVAACAA